MVTTGEWTITNTNTTRGYIAEGDSITEGDGQTPYCDQFSSNSTPSLNVYHNEGTPGLALGTMIARGSSLIDALFPLVVGHNILSVLIGANDLTNYSGNATNFCTDLAGYLDARRSVGWKVVLCTLLPQNNSPFNVFRNSINGIVRGWFLGQHYDGLADFGADSIMGTNTSFTDHPSDWFDSIHPSTTGHSILETIIRPVINGL